MTTLRRELIEKIKEAGGKYLDKAQYFLDFDAMYEDIADAVLEVRAFKRGSEEWKEEMGAELAEKSLEAAIYAGKPARKGVTDKNRDAFELEAMIDAQLARLPLNWTGFPDKDQENFRKWIKKERKENGKELETWVNWWMSDEWRVSSPPWKLETIKIKWLEAFVNQPKETPPSEPTDEIYI